MAIRRGIIGRLSGRLEDLVFGSWKGIQTVRTFTPPSNPRTVAQVSTRTVFGKLGHLASQFHALGITDAFPPARRMTRLNQIVRANGAMIASKVFTPQDLQICTANFLQFIQPMIFSGNLHTSGSLEITAEFNLRTRNPFEKIHIWIISINNDTLDVVNAEDFELTDSSAGTDDPAYLNMWSMLQVQHTTGMTILGMVYGTLRNGRKCIFPTQSISI
jgi:hypothetical protein